MESGNAQMIWIGTPFFEHLGSCILGRIYALAEIEYVDEGSAGLFGTYASPYNSNPAELRPHSHNKHSWPQDQPTRICLRKIKGGSIVAFVPGSNCNGAAASRHEALNARELALQCP